MTGKYVLPTFRLVCGEKNVSRRWTTTTANERTRSQKFKVLELFCCFEFEEED
jgi:hypothetical protein